MTRRPTIVPVPDFDAASDAQVLREACKGLGTDEDAIIDVITKRTIGERLEIAATFKTMYGKDLIDDLKSELNGNFEDVILALMTPPFEYQAKQLHKAISGLGTDEGTIAEILSVHDNEEIRAISQEYERLYERSLEDDISGDTSGTVRRLFVSLSTGHRDESDETDREKATEDAQTLLSAGELLWGTDESTFNMILCQRNRRQLKLIFKEYERLAGHPFETAIDNEFSGDSKDSLIALVRSVRDREDYLATRLHDALAGMGTDDETLIRIVVSRAEIDLEEIKDVFEQKYERSLAEAIDGDCSGDYKKCLLSVVAGNQ